MKELGEKLSPEVEKIQHIFNSSYIAQWFGRIGNGKTTLATISALNDLKNGKVVYTSWPIKTDMFDERYNIFNIFRSLIFFKANKFYRISDKNLRYIDMYADNIIDYIDSLTDCVIYLDEGHRIFNSYELTRMEKKKQELILHTRHFDRTIHIISQRPTAIHTVLRENVDRFYKCELVWTFMVLVFKRTEYQDMKAGTVDLDMPVSSEYYIGRKKYLNAFDSKYLRKGRQSSQYLEYEVYKLTYLERLIQFFKLLFLFFFSYEKKNKND